MNWNWIELWNLCPYPDLVNSWIFYSEQHAQRFHTILHSRLQKSLKTNSPLTSIKTGTFSTKSQSNGSLFELLHKPQPNSLPNNQSKPSAGYSNLSTIYTWNGSVWDSTQIHHLCAAWQGDKSIDNPSEVSWHLLDMNNTVSDFQQSCIPFQRLSKWLFAGLHFKETGTAAGCITVYGHLYRETITWGGVGAWRGGDFTSIHLSVHQSIRRGGPRFRSTSKLLTEQVSFH